jgi:26S proteasome non-ATPase regulatory subunit 10
MVELLLKNKSPINPADAAGQTPLHHAIAEGHGKYHILNASYVGKSKGFSR